MFKSETASDRSLRSELRKAENRERIAQCKLDRLKERFDRLYDEVSTSQKALESVRGECDELREQLAGVQSERDRASQEALMWRTQLFERMDLLEDAKRKLKAAEHELEVAWERAGQATIIHQSSHEELKKRDRERLVFELKIDELQKSQKETRDQANDLLEALTEAESAIASLQRNNAVYEREIDGLKSLGASLTEQLTKANQHVDKLKERNSSLYDELRLEKAHSEHLQSELELLKDKYYETKSQLVTMQMEADVRQMRKAGQEKSAVSHRDKFGDFPAVTKESPVARPIGRDVLSRATKKMSGWFRLSDSSES